MEKKIDKKIIYLFIYVVCACLLISAAKPPYIVGILLVLAPPSLINFLWLKNSKLKIFLFSAASALLFAPPIELMSRLADAWDVASIFPRPFGLIPVENMLFAFLNFFWVLSFYQYFIDKNADSHVAKKFKFLLAIFAFFAAAVFSLFFWRPDIVKTNYYTMAVPILIIPGILIFAKYPRLLRKTVIPTIFFALVFFTYEMFSLNIGHWWWPGTYLFPLKINGNTFPLDDVIIWYLLSTPVLIGGYEFFMDDRK